MNAKRFVLSFPLTRAALAIGFVVSLALPSTVVAQTAAPRQSAMVVIHDDAFSPTVVTIYAGGTVVWVNNGLSVHTATQAFGQSFGMNSGGLQPRVCIPGGPPDVPAGCSQGPSFQFTFASPGQYFYTSATDCLFGNHSGTFDCTPAEVDVVPAPAGGFAPAPAPEPAVPASTPTALPVYQTATVTVNDAGFSPAAVSVTVGGTVTWMNAGNGVHSVTSLPGSPARFDLGGLASGQSGSFNFVQPGTYSYTSSPDCVAAPASAFQCGLFTVLVTAAIPNATPVPSAPPPAPSATPIATVTPAANTNVTIDDTAGFSPQTLNVKAGQTVTWTNQGTVVHSVVSNYGIQAWFLAPSDLPFDSGGLASGQQFSFTFNRPGTYNYHSSTEPIVSNNNPNVAGNAAITYQFNGVIIVSP